MAALLRSLRDGSPLLFWTAVAHAVCVPVLMLLAAGDSRSILGLNPWIKPMKFVVSTAIYAITVAFLMRELGYPRASSKIAWLIALSMIVENSLILMQSLRGVRSHFNADSIFDSAVFTTMGFFIVLNTIAMAWFLWEAFSAGEGLQSGYLWGIRLGIAVFIIGSAQAGLMLRVASHTVGGSDGGPGLPFLNWSTRFGDLRVGHFIGLHALQALPLAGWLIDRMEIPNPALAVSVAAFAYAAVVILATLQALSGKPTFF